MNSFAVIFDVDGVLNDGVSKYFEHLEAYFREKNITPKENLVKHLNGRSIKEIREILLHEYGIDGASQEYEHKVGRKTHEYLVNEYKPAKELMTFLNELKNTKTVIALATSNTQYRVGVSLSKLEMTNSDFHAVTTSEHVQKAKPHPEIYLTTAQKLGVKPQNCVVFEDAPNGILAAKLAGMKVVGIITKLHSKEELSQADLVISHFGEVNLRKIKELIASA